MRKFLRSILCAPLVLVLAACGSVNQPGSSSPGVTTGIAGNNSATLTGATMGTNETPSADLRKTLLLTLVTPHPDLELGPAYLTRTSATSQYGSLIAEVMNHGGSPRCFVRANNLTYRSTDATLVTAPLAYVDGSVGKTSSGTVTSTCLGPGETGFLINMQAPNSTTNLFWSDATSVEIESLSTSTSTIEDHGGRLKPTSYSVSGSTFQSLAVTGENQGTITVYPDSSTVYVLLDEAGEPLEWFYLDPASDSVEVGQSAEWMGSPFYEGAASRVRVIVGFDTQPQTSSLGVQDDPPTSRAEFLESRTRAAAIGEGLIDSASTR